MMPKTKYKLLMIAVWSLFLPKLALAQDPIYSQFFAAPLQINPAFAGVSKSPRVMINYRNQWPAWPNAYQTYAVAYEQRIDQLNSGFGMMLQADVAGNGIYKTQNASLFYSYNLRTTKNLFLKFGVQGGYIGNQIAWDQLVFGDQLDQRNGLGSSGTGTPSREVRPNSLSNNALDLSAGVLAYSKHFYAGLALQHLNSPDNNFLHSTQALSLGRPIRYTLTLGSEIDFLKNNNGRVPAFISPNLLVVRQGDFTQINGGAYVAYDTFFGGMWYRQSGGNPDAVVFLVGFRYDLLRIGYSYDATISSLALNRTGGSHELSMSLSFDDQGRNRKGKRRKVDINDCFKMFH
jgi:type IX secretion system PorP/SprF family membrane protein